MVTCTTVYYTLLTALSEGFIALSVCLRLIQKTEGFGIRYYLLLLLLLTFCRQAISFDPDAQSRAAQPVKVDRLSSILSQIVSVGEHEKVVQGIFENYPNTKYRDASMRVVRGLKLFQVFHMAHTAALVHLLHSAPRYVCMCMHVFVVSPFPDCPRTGVGGVPGRVTAYHHDHTELQPHLVPAVCWSGSSHPPGLHREAQDSLPSQAV